MTFRYHIEVAPGCYSAPHAPTISRHRTLRAALDQARRCDRLVAVDTETGERWQIPQQGDLHLGAGRYGKGITPSEARNLGWPL